MVTLEQINRWFVVQPSDPMEVVDAIISIGNESTDPSKAYQAGGWSAMGFGGIRTVPVHTVWPTKEGMYEFHKKNARTGEWEPDPRIVKIGDFINRCGGFDNMQAFFYEVKKHYNGSMRSLESAWGGIGQWKSPY